jgi:low temperature requirement protein LtrA
MVAGIIVTAVADELVLAHPEGHMETGTALAILGGPALYILGNLLFKANMASRVPLSHLLGLGLLGVGAAMAPILSPLLLNTFTTGALMVVAGWEMLSLTKKTC